MRATKMFATCNGEIRIYLCRRLETVDYCGGCRWEVSEMKYFISLDMEGVGGLVSWSETSQEQRELITGETCAAIEGIRSVDKKAAILIADSHGRMQNLLLDRLPQ